jgi:recombination protein RecR
VLPQRLQRLVQLFARLPGVGEKTAQRFALLLVGEVELGRALATELRDLAEVLAPCARCGNVAERDAGGRAVCAICSDQRRDSTILCVVGRVQDLVAIERSSAMRGRYFVLGKLLSPLDGIGPDQIPLERLRQRIADDQVREVIVATPTSVDGEATALLLARELGASGVRISRIASGVPHGGDLEFADQITLGRALDGRRDIELGRKA